MLTLGFAGLPSAGKSTIVNALAGKRVLESGVCRTTTEPCIVGTTNSVGAQKWVRARLESDDGVEFCALDLPGICDAEDKKGSFNKVTREWAAKCDVVVWVTDARTAFLTTHEASEYAALRAAIQEKADEDGTLYQFLVVIAKFDASTAESTNATKGNAGAGMVFLEDEIRTGSEETTIESCFERVERAFPSTRVVKFSAFARIVNSGSEALRALVSARSERTDGTNAAFDLRWATENLVEKRLAQMTRVLRSTRQRAIAAETRAIAAETRIRTVDAALAALKSRVDPSPVYSTIVEFEVVQQTAPIHSFTMMIDTAVAFSKYAFSGSEEMRVTRAGNRTLTIEMSLIGGMRDITQIIAPMVRPVYGDVVFVHAAGAEPKLVIYACDAVGEKYTLKVGEVKRDQVAALGAALLRKTGCRWRCKGY